MRDVIFISLENWDGIWRRNQFLCADWMRRFPHMRILFVGMARDVSNAARKGGRGVLTEVLKPSVRSFPEFPGLTLFNPLKLWPNSLRLGRLLNLRTLANGVRHHAGRLGFRNPILWINDHFGEPLVGCFGERAVVYDVTDDWALLPSAGSRERQRIREADRALCKKADLVVVCSEALELSRKQLSQRVVRVPNGVDAAHYKACSSEHISRLHSNHDHPRSRASVFGYLGTLHGDRLDIGLVLALGKACPRATVRLCGPDFLTPSEKEALAGAPNIELCPPVDYARVPEILSQFDVCILPHRCTSFTESLNPIKLWEYLATGKPIAATPVAGFREFADLCHLGAGPGAFVNACKDALLESDPASARKRVALADCHSWRARSDQLLALFQREGWCPRECSSLRQEPRNGAAGDFAGFSMEASCRSLQNGAGQF